jgi:hypothetical protein
MIIQPANVDAITAAVKAMWTEDPDLAGVQIERYEELTRSPGTHGWACIYRERVDRPPRTLGMGAGYRNELVRLFAMVCESDPSSGEECGQRLDALLQKLVKVLLNDPSLRGTVQTLADEFSTVYFDYSKNEDGMFLQYAQLNFTGIIPVSAT